MKIGNKIKQLRENKKYSQEKLANLLNVHPVTISKWENGTQEPRIKSLSELAKIFNVSNEYLLNDTSDEVGEYHNGNNISTTEAFNDDLLTFKWGGGNELKAPNTPAGREMIERIALALIKSTGDHADIKIH